MEAQKSHTIKGHSFVPLSCDSAEFHMTAHDIYANSSHNLYANSAYSICANRLWLLTTSIQIVLITHKGQAALWGSSMSKPITT